MFPSNLWLSSYWCTYKPLSYVCVAGFLMWMRFKLWDSVFYHYKNFMFVLFYVLCSTMCLSELWRSNVVVSLALWSRTNNPYFIRRAWGSVNSVRFRHPLYMDCLHGIVDCACLCWLGHLFKIFGDALIGKAGYSSLALFWGVYICWIWNNIL
jgi:hypothetical protein